MTAHCVLEATDMCSLTVPEAGHPKSRCQHLVLCWVRGSPWEDPCGSSGVWGPQWSSVTPGSWVHLYLLTYFWLSWVFVVSQAFSRCGGRGLLIAGTALLADTGPGAHGLQKLWLPGSAVLQHVGSSRTRDQSPVPSTVRRNLSHWTSRESPCGSVTAGSLSIFTWLSPLCVSVPSLSLIKCTCH